VSSHATAKVPGRIATGVLNITRVAPPYRGSVPAGGNRIAPSRSARLRPGSERMGGAVSLVSDYVSRER
jgi:hypothetical protein